MRTNVISSLIKGYSKSDTSVPTKRIAQSIRPSRHLSFKKNLPWRNKSRTAGCTPEYSCFPKTIEELVGAAHFAREFKKRLTAVADGNSWSGLVSTNDLFVYMHGLDRAAVDLSDLDEPKVVVEIGATLKRANSILKIHGYTLPFHTARGLNRFGDLITCSSQGVYPALLEQMAWIEIVDTEGKLHRFESRADIAKAINAACMNLGKIGIIYRMALKVNKTWKIRRR